MEKKIAITVEEAKEAFGWLQGCMDEYGTCEPEEGKCYGRFNPLSMRCRACRKVGGFLAIEYKEE